MPKSKFGFGVQLYFFTYFRTSSLPSLCLSLIHRALVCCGTLCGNENQAEPLKPARRWLHHLLHPHPFWVTLLSSPRPPPSPHHPPASASNQNGSKWWPPCLPSVAEDLFFPAGGRASEQSLSWEQKVLDSSNAAPPTARSPEWCCNFHEPPCEVWRVVLFFSFFFFLPFVLSWFHWRAALTKLFCCYLW